MLVADVFGALGIADDDYVRINVVGIEYIWDATQAILGNHNRDLAAAESILVERTVSHYTTRYKLAYGSRLQRVTNTTRAAATKMAGEWDTAFPLEEFGDRISGDRVQMGYMTNAEYGRQVASVLESDINTRRFEMLKAIFNNGGGAPRTFVDPLRGSLSIQPLANGDTTKYPALIGSETPATANHYLTSGFASSDISDVNDPVTPLVRLLENRFGLVTGGPPIVVFMNAADLAPVQAMIAFNPIEGRFVRFGDNVTQAANYPDNLPGVVIGEVNGALIVRWDWIPSGYELAIHLGAPAPLFRRVDPPETGLSSGLQLLSTFMENRFRDAEWSNRFGYGVGNRLNGAVMQLTAGGSYTTPTAYA